MLYNIVLVSAIHQHQSVIDSFLKKYQTIFKVFLGFVTLLLLLLMLSFFGSEAHGILAPYPSEVAHTPLTLEDEVLTTDCQGSPPGGHS